MSSFHTRFPLFGLALLVGAVAWADQAPPAASPAPEAPDELPTVAEKTAGLERREGLLDLWIDGRTGRIYLEVPAASEERGTVGRYLYVEGLVTGLGSNPVGLDRGQLGETRLVTLRRLGGRLLVEAENTAFRALSDAAQEVRAVEESFADSVLWAGPLAALDPDGRALVDFTSFAVRDAHDVVGTLRRTGQGAYTLDPERSVVDLGACLAFPDNLELEAVLTYGAAAEPGPLAGRTAASPRELTLRQHHSLVRLPDPGYEPRAFAPRSGSYAVEFTDYAAPLDAPVRSAWLVRHRLEPGETLVYHVDRGAPEPVRSALVEGASWWAEAFAAAGFEDGFRVELLPEDVHPLDVRYNVIQWVHRATRGWSYGGGVVDPRTGEMIKGHVSLGSLRVRQDRLIFEGLAGTERTGTGAPDDPVELALARIRQLAAHEVGHTLGLAHNFAASTYGRASVMDYPAPLVAVGEDGALDFSRVYGVGVGAFDLQSIRYAYTRFPPGTDEEAALAAILEENRQRELLFLTDKDARPPGAADPRANLWDNLEDPVAGLRQALAVRRAALESFGEGNVRPGQPLALLREVLVPVYLYHRYQLEAAVKVVGGLEYDYAVRGEENPAARPVAAHRQRGALDTVLSTLDPATLDLPDRVLELLLPMPFGYPDRPRNRELFASGTAPAFDALGAAATAADLTVSGLLHPDRAGRLVDFARRDPSLPSLEDVLGALVETAFGESGASGDGTRAEPREAELRRAVQAVVVDGLIGLASDPAASPAVRARTEAALAALRDRLARPADADRAGPTAAQDAYLVREIERHLSRERSDATPLTAAAGPPPGSPIGGSGRSGAGSGSTAGGGPDRIDRADRVDWLGRGCSWNEIFGRQ